MATYYVDLNGGIGTNQNHWTAPGGTPSGDLAATINKCLSLSQTKALFTVRTICVSTLHIFGIYPILHRRDLQRQTSTV